MIWDSVNKADFLSDNKVLVVRLAISISRKLDLGQPIDGFLDDLYLMTNITFTLEEGSSDLVDADYDYLFSVYNKVRINHNRYKGLMI